MIPPTHHLLDADASITLQALLAMADLALVGGVLSPTVRRQISRPLLTAAMTVAFAALPCLIFALGRI
ncbi:hypothetical protein LN042_28725 [Kitasatospora sp. RB6PN24]|uniref:hypothetical protein n=1 Tax=Kitasatospora humi TaxID=2893891 RepID=UPI001E5A6285|nr:hypothetical protein [Kitasatospora humi]MCC9311006.1 hypothetical protein [Kitasatospora humi]